MGEPDVTLTDYALALECAICAAFLALTPTCRKGLGTAGVGFFAFLGASAAAGGTVHGFYPDEQSPEGRLLWLLTLLLVGLAALSAWTLGASMLSSGRATRWLVFPAFVPVGCYGVVVLLITQEYWITMTVSLPAALLLLVGFCQAVWRSRHLFLFLGALGLVLTFVAAFIQLMKFCIHPVYFNHNAFYHCVQAVGLALIFLGIRYLVGSARETDDLCLVTANRFSTEVNRKNESRASAVRETM
jgi:hypothetical protein